MRRPLIALLLATQAVPAAFAQTGTLVYGPPLAGPHVGTVAQLLGLPCGDGAPFMFFKTDGASTSDCGTGQGDVEGICLCLDGSIVAIGAGGGGPHASTHEVGGVDEIDVTGLPGVLAEAQPISIGGDTYAGIGDTDCVLTPEGGGFVEMTCGDGIGFYNSVADEAFFLPQRGTINFIGDAIECADNDMAGRTDCTVTDDDVPEVGDFGALALAGDVTSAGLATAISIDTIGPAEMADADHGDVSWSSGVATVDSGAVGVTDLADDATCAGLQVVRRNAGDTAFECGAGGGDDNIAEGRAVGGGLTALQYPGFSCGGSMTSSGAGAARIYYEPIVAATPITINLLSIGVMTAAAGETARLGIYNADLDWQPTTLVLDAGTVDISTVGTKSISINQSLAAGRYLLAFRSQSSAGAFRWLIGCGPTFVRGEDMTSSANVTARFLLVATAYGAFPSTGITWDTPSYSNTGFWRVVAVRVSTP